jgi:type IV pilus assembly protein PilY1
MWEFKQNPVVCPGTPAAAVGNTADCNLGLTFGKAVITKLAGTWVVMFTSGYNNLNGASNGLDGGGFLYVLNAVTGAIIHKIPTEEIVGTNVGTGANPSGLAQINNYVDNVDVDNKTLRAYGGDVLGNIFRFEFPPLATDASATLMGIARDPDNGVRQPITVRPELAELDGKPFVIVGTGRLLGGDDVDPLKSESQQRQSVYGLRDTLGAGPVFPEPMRPELRPMRVFQSAGTPSASTVREIRCNGTDTECARPRGWVLDLAEVGERVNVEMKLILGALVFASNTPSLEPCTVGGHSWFNQVDFRTAAPIPGAITSQYLSDSLNVGFNVLQLPLHDGQQNPTYTGLFRQKKGTNVNKNITPPEPPTLGNRISWREIAQ